MNDESRISRLSSDKLARLWDIGSDAGDSAAHQDANQFAATPQIEGYQVLGELGKGGMGTVWRAVQLSTRREVALKVMSAKAFGSRKTLSRFEREVELAARLQHPNITRVYDSGIDRGLYYYVMELIDGEHLDTYVKHHKLGQKQILELMLVVCRAIQHAHQLGVIHRDLKPSNILVPEDGQPHILDFGLAKGLADKDSSLTLSMAGEMIGTLPYMSPEQAAGRQDELDTRTDVYSLGLMLYRLLTGKSPHDLSGTQYTVTKRIAEDEVVRPRAINRQIDEELEAVLLKALAHKPENRYNTAGDLAEDVSGYLNGEPLTARPPTTMYFLRKRIRKHRTRIVAWCLIVAIVIGATLATTTLSRYRKTKAIQQFKEQATALLADGRYQAAEQTFAKVLALNKNDAAAQDGITKARDQEELARDLTLAQQYVSESRFDLALGLALSAQQRFPDDPRVLEMVRLAKGTTKLSVDFDLGTLTRATLRKISTGVNEITTDVDIEQFPNGVDIEPGWYWLNLFYEPEEAEDSPNQAGNRYLLLVQRSIPYELHVKKITVGDVPGADFTTLSEALNNCQPGHVLSLAPGLHQLRLSPDYRLSRFQILTPNIIIENQDPDAPATIELYYLYVLSTWDVRFLGLTINGVKKEGSASGGGIQFKDSVLCQVVGCTLQDIPIDGENCDGLEIKNNVFSATLDFVHRRSVITNSRRVVVRGNKVKSTRDVGWTVFNMTKCANALVLDNTINSSALTGICFRTCSEPVVVGNEVRDCFEGNVRLINSDGSLVAYNELTQGSLYNLSLFSSGNAIIQHNEIRKGKTGIHLTESGRSSYFNNLVTGATTGILCSGAAYNTVRRNIFLGNEQCVAGEGSYWGEITLEENLMGRSPDPNSMGNTRLHDVNNAVCNFELEETEDNMFRINIGDKQTALDFSGQSFGPALGLKRQYLNTWNSVADVILEFGQMAESFTISEEFGNQLSQTSSELISKICSLGRPASVEPVLLGALDVWAAAQELRKNQDAIPQHVKSFEDHHYVLYTQPMTWKEAKRSCESVGGHLATITSQEEDDWIRKTFPQSWQFWLGATDEAKENEWQWVTGEDWQYSSWGSDQSGGKNENALCLWVDHSWHDAYMDWKLPFLIEWDK